MAAASGVRQRRVGKETPSFVVGLKIKVGSVMEISKHGGKPHGRRGQG